MESNQVLLQFPVAFHLGYNSEGNENTVIYVAPFDGNKCQLPRRKCQVLKNV